MPRSDSPPDAPEHPTVAWSHRLLATNALAQLNAAAVSHALHKLLREAGVTLPVGLSDQVDDLLVNALAPPGPASFRPISSHTCVCGKPGACTDSTNGAVRCSLACSHGDVFYPDGRREPPVDGWDWAGSAVSP